MGRNESVFCPIESRSVVDHADGKVGREQRCWKKWNIFTRVIDRPPVESPPGRSCNSVAHACPVSRCFARASTHAMSRCHGLTQLTRGCNPSLSWRSSRVDRAHSAQIDAHASILPRRARTSRNIRAPPPSTSVEPVP